MVRSAELLSVPMEANAHESIAERSRRTPRVANRLLKRVRDYAQVKHDGIITSAIADQALELLHIDRRGLDEIDRKILHAIIHTFNGGPVGIETLAASVAEDIDTIEMIYEPYLLQIGMIERTPRGRKTTGDAHTHMHTLPV